MQTQAHAPRSNHATTAPAPRLYQMLPGSLFRLPKEHPGAPAAAHRGVLALLHYGNSAASDNARIWCVVVMCNAHDGSPGEFFGLPRDIEVQRFHLAAPVQLAVEH